MIPIIDTHQHLWDLTKFRLPWLQEDSPLARSHLMRHYLTEAEGLNIVRTVYMEVDLEPSQRPAEAEYVLVLCRSDDNPMAGAVIGGDPADSEFETYARRHAGDPQVKGFRQVLHGPQPPGYCLEPEFVRGIRLLGEIGKSFDFCLRSTELKDGAKLAEICPDTRFILDHCGNADVKSTDLSQWKRDMDAIARRPNLICKISGIIASAPQDWSAEQLAPIILHTAEVFGPDRIMFASDWPVCTLRATLRQWIEALQSIVSAWPEPDQRKLFHDNAARFYGLKSSPA